MDIKLRQIISKSAGTYFIVTDNSQVPVIEEENRLRLVFINSKKGVYNVPVRFARGDINGFQSIFGKPKRALEVAGNFSHQTCIDALSAGSLAVVNLLNITDEKTSKTHIDFGDYSENDTKAVEVNYKDLFNSNAFWTLKSEGLVKDSGGGDVPLLTFGNAGTSQLSIFVTVALPAEVANLTEEGDKYLHETVLTFEEYKALVSEGNEYLTVKDLFVTVWVFGTDLTVGTSTNPYYGHLFDSNGNIKYNSLEALSKITASGYITKYTGIAVPGMVNEVGDNISIDTLINDDYINVGLIAYLNASLLDSKTSLYRPYLLDGFTNFDATNLNIKSSNTATDAYKYLDYEGTGYIFSHVLPDYVSMFEPGATIGKEITDANKKKFSLPQTSVFSYLLADTEYKNVDNIDKNLFDDIFVDGYKQETLARLYEIENIPGKDKTYKTHGKFGIRQGDLLLDASGKYVRVTSYIRDESDPDKYIFTTDGKFETTVEFIVSKSLPTNCFTPSGFIDTIANSADWKSTTVRNAVYKIQPYYKMDSYLKPMLLTGVVISDTLFDTSSNDKLKENVLNLMVSPGIIKGCKGLQGLRYVIDAFKTYLAPAYKDEYINFCAQLDEGNRFVRAIINEPFVDDLINSTDPAFYQLPSKTFDASYLPDGGNKDLSTKLLTKPALNASFGFYFGPGDIVKGIIKPLAGKISNLFVSKTYQFDIVANQTGYISGITALEYDFDDVERQYCEKFRYNPIINFNGGYTIFGNNTAQKERTAQQQIHNSELLAYIKESLYNLSKSEAFTKGNYDDYLRTEIETKNFMDALVLAGAIDPNPVVQCDAKNNTLEIRKQRIKLVHVEYTPVDCIEKVVFDLTIN
jgi:hypothetical protein